MYRMDDVYVIYGECTWRMYTHIPQHSSFLWAGGGGRLRARLLGRLERRLAVDAYGAAYLSGSHLLTYILTYELTQ